MASCLTCRGTERLMRAIKTARKFRPPRAWFLNNQFPTAMSLSWPNVSSTQAQVMVLSLKPRAYAKLECTSLQTGNSARKSRSQFAPIVNLKALKKWHCFVPRYLRCQPLNHCHSQVGLEILRYTLLAALAILTMINRLRQSSGSSYPRCSSMTTRVSYLGQGHLAS
jgi:hypothetical protein